jgi:endonuclease/exonuclease/phosphatase family metal-dependent hydrolase
MHEVVIVFVNLFQAAATIRELVTVAGGADQPHVICGDFNSCPDSPVHQLTKEGYLNDASMAALQGVQEVKLADGRVSYIQFNFYNTACDTVCTQVLINICSFI